MAFSTMATITVEPTSQWFVFSPQVIQSSIVTRSLPDSTLGTTDAIRNALLKTTFKSSSVAFVRNGLTRTSLSDLPKSIVRKACTMVSLAASFLFSATPSSRSMQTQSTPNADAFCNL